MLRVIAVYLVVVFAAVPSSLQAAQPTILHPTEPWRVDYGTDECRLIRTFGSGPQAIVLRLARGGNIGNIDMVIAGASIPKLPPRVSVKMSLLPQAASQSSPGYSMAVPGKPLRFVRWFDADMTLFEGFGGNQLVEIDAGTFSVQLNLTLAKPALDALQVCYVDLLKSWGIGDSDAAALAAIRSGAGQDVSAVMAQQLGAPRRKGRPGAWLTSADYPTEALRQDQGGTVVVLVNVGETGLPEKCNVVISSKVPVLDEQTCAVLLRRTRYSPGQDADGKPKRSVTVERVRWLVPDF